MVVLGAAAAMLVAKSSRAPGLAAFALLTAPLFGLGGLLATPDVPLTCCWALGLWAAMRERWWLVGLAWGLAMLSKYTGLLMVPLLLAASPSDLRKPGPYIAAVIAFAVYAPNTIWNLQHDLISWQFQLSHVQEAPRRLDFLGAQLGLGGPLLALVGLAWWLVGWRSDRREERLCWFTAVPLLVLATWIGGEANWAAPAWVSTLVGLTYRRTERWRRAAWIGAGINLTLGGMVMLHAVSPLIDVPNDPTHRLHMGRTLGESMQAWGVEPVYTDRYQEASLIAFYGGVETYTLPNSPRRSQFDIWAPPLAERAMFVRVWRDTPHLKRVADLGYTWSSISTVTAYAPTTRKVESKPIMRWNVAEITRPSP